MNGWTRKCLNRERSNFGGNPSQKDSQMTYAVTQKVTHRAKDLFTPANYLRYWEVLKQISALSRGKHTQLARAGPPTFLPSPRKLDIRMLSWYSLRQ